MHSLSRTAFSDYEHTKLTFKLPNPTYYNFSKDCFEKWVYQVYYYIDLAVAYIMYA